jgi:hypothetical protein
VCPSYTADPEVPGRGAPAVLPGPIQSDCSDPGPSRPHAEGRGARLHSRTVHVLFKVPHCRCITGDTPASAVGRESEAPARARATQSDTAHGSRLARGWLVRRCDVTQCVHDAHTHDNTPFLITCHHLSSWDKRPALTPAAPSLGDSRPGQEGQGLRPPARACPLLPLPLQGCDLAGARLSAAAVSRSRCIS